MKELSKYYHQGLRIKFNIDLQDLKDEQMPTVVSGKKLSESSEVRPGMCCVWISSQAGDMKYKGGCGANYGIFSPVYWNCKRFQQCVDV